jgi:hypothetical protein
MTDDRVADVARLLEETEAAHGRYEAEELNGVYDEAWASWYASHAVENGIGQHLGEGVSAESLADALTAAYAEHQSSGSDEGWSSGVARRIVDRFGMRP